MGCGSLRRCVHPTHGKQHAHTGMAHRARAWRCCKAEPPLCGSGLRWGWKSGIHEAGARQACPHHRRITRLLITRSTASGRILLLRPQLPCRHNTSMSTFANQAASQSGEPFTPVRRARGGHYTSIPARGEQQPPVLQQRLQLRSLSRDDDAALWQSCCCASRCRQVEKRLSPAAVSSPH